MRKSAAALVLVLAACGGGDPGFDEDALRSRLDELGIEATDPVIETFREVCVDFTDEMRESFPDLAEAAGIADAGDIQSLMDAACG